MEKSDNFFRHHAILLNQLDIWVGALKLTSDDEGALYCVQQVKEQAKYIHLLYVDRQEKLNKS